MRRLLLWSVNRFTHQVLFPKPSFMTRAPWDLKECDLFEGLTPPQAQRLDRRARVRAYRRRAIIYSPTEPGQSVLLLTAGLVKVKDLTPDGKETILAFIEEGELFGELALLDADPRQEYAEAVEDCEVVVLPREDLLRLMDERPDLARYVIRLIGVRRRRIEKRLRNVLFLPSRERLVRLLRELVEAHGERRGQRAEIRLPLSHQDMASMIGVTRETVTAVLGQLQADGLVKVQRRRITVLDCARLDEESLEVAGTVYEGRPSQRSAPTRGAV
jgi:CRP-like cAMP-binding protein